MSESIDLKLNFDISSFLGQLSNAKEQVSSLKAELEETPGTPKALNAGLDRTQHTINMLEKKAHAVNKLSDGRKDAVAGDLMAGLEEINMSTQLFSEGGKFSTNLAKQMFDGFPEAVKKELSSNTKEIEKLIRSSVGSIVSLGASNMARDIQMTDDAKRIFGTRFKKTSSDQFVKYIEMQLPHALPAYMMEEYQMLSKGTTSKIYASVHPHEIIPKAFQTAFKNKNYTSSGSSNGLFMQEEQRKILRNLISENDAAMRAAEKVDGMIRRSTAGRAQLNRNITQAQYDQFKSNMWKDWVLRASGSQSNRVDLFADNLSASDERKLLSRMTSSSAGRVLSAMNSLDPFETAAAWATSTKQKGYETLKKEARRELEQYEIARFRFGDVFSGKEKWRPVALSESQNTRLLGLSGMHNQFTDKVAILDLAGYDKENKEHQKLLEQLSSGKEVSLPGSNKKYIAQNLHGTGRNTTFRLIEAEAYKTVRDREKAWLEQQGFAFSGNNYWNNLVGEDYVFESEEALRKHYDATGKGWTPGYQVKSQQKDKNFGIVDFSKISDAGQKAKQADGLAWMAKGILPEGSIQARLGISGKGVVNEMPFKTMGDWAVNAGLIKPGERFILPGPRGDVDVTDQNGISDVSQVKNISAYGNFKSGEEINRAFTALMQRYGISTVTSFGNAESKVDSLGHQAMMFMKLSPEIVEKQMAAADRRLKMLDTEAGIREFILSDPNDYLAKMLREGRIQPTDNIIQSRVQKEKDSIVSRLASGEWLDFDGSVSGYNQKVNKTLMTSLVEFGGGSREEKIQKLRKLMKDKGLTREYTDDEIAGIWGLGGVKGGAIVDFLRPEEEFVAVNRAPNGIAQFVSGKNYAKLARDVYKKFGISTNGVFLSEEDMLTLGDADFDGDGVKVMYGDTAHEMGRASDLYNEIINKLAITSNAQHVKDNNSVSGSVTDTPEQRRRAAEDSVAAVMAMGLTSSAGEKATMFDLTDPRNRDMLIAAVQANPAYSIATVLGKRGGHVELTKEMWAASRQGKTWQKQPSKYSNLFNVTGKDDMDIPDDERIYVSNEGVKVNQDQQEEMDIDTINLPSANQDSTQVGLRIASQIGASPEGQKRKRAILEALDKVVGYGEFGEKTKAFMQNMRGLKLGMATGDRGITTKEEDEILAMQLSEAYKEVTDLAKSKLIDGGGGKVRLGDGTEKKYGEYLSELQKQAGIDVARAYLYTYGATTDRIIKTYGEEEGTKIVEDLTSHSGVDLMNTKVSSAEDLLNPQKTVAQQENTVATSFKGKKPKSRKFKQAQRNAKKAEEATQAAEEKIDDSISIFEQYEKIKTFEGSLQAEKELSEYISEVSGKWYKIHTKVDEDPEKSFYALSLYQQRKAQNEYDIASTHGDSAVFGSGTATGENLFASQQGMEANYFLATRAHLTQSGESALESLRNSVQGVGDEFDKQQATLEKWSSEVGSLQKQLDAFKQSREQYSSKANSDLEADAQAISEQEKRIVEAKKLEEQGRENLLKSNDLRFSEDIDQLMYQLTGKTAGRQEKISREVESRKMQLERERAAMEEAYNKKLLSDESYKKLLPKFDEVSKYIDEEYRKKLETQYTDKTHKEVASFIRHGDRMDLAHRRRAIDNTMYGRYLAQAENELEQRRHYDEMGTLKLEELKNAQAPQTEIDKLTKSLNRNKEAMESLEGARGKLSAGFLMLDDAVTRVVTRQGKQLLSKAMNELKRFTLEFNADMTEIQAITMKSDDEMADVRKNTLNDAVKYRTSVSNVSSVRKDLYRQGLSDAEVDERSGSILKFAKVTAIKTQDATKIITTAQQNNLVDSAEEAMDALVALGDNAATTATEIGNAMQKCAAAAKVAGVSYAELTPMLATMTSMTQLSGKQVGTAMNTILTRLHNVTANNYTKEINGEVTSLNDVEKALGTIGVSLRDDDGGWRKSTDVLLDIAERWQSMTDIQKSLVSTSVAATRSGNMFQTLMEGMSEDGGETFREYQDLAENSDGITDRKYEVTVRSLASAVDTLQSSFDRLVSGLESSGVLPSIVDFFSETLNNVSMLIENIPEIGSAFATIIPTLAVAAGLLVMMRTGTTGAGMLVGLGVAGAGLLAASAIGSGVSASDSEVLAAERAEAAQNRFENYKKVNTAKTKYENASSLINESRSLIEKSQELGESMDSAAETKLDECIKQLTLLFPDQANEIDNANASVNNYTSFQNKASEANDRLLESEYERARILADMAAEENFDKYVEENVKDLFFDREDFKGFIDETYSVDVDPALSADFVQDKQAQGYSLNEQFTKQGLMPGNDDDDDFLKAFELLQEYIYDGKSQTEEERELIGKYTAGYENEGFLYDRFVPTEDDAKIIEKKISDLEVEIDSVNQKESDLDYREPIDKYLKFIMLSEESKGKKAERLRLSSPETIRKIQASDVPKEIQERFPEAFDGSNSWPLYSYLHYELDAEKIKTEKEKLKNEQTAYSEALRAIQSAFYGSYGEIYTNPDIYHFPKASNERFWGSLDVMLSNRAEDLDVPFEQEVGMDALYNIQRILDYNTGYSKIKDFNMSVMDDLLSTLFSQGKIEDYDMFGYGNSQEFVDDARTGFNKLRKLEEYDVYVQNIAQAVFDAVENGSLETYFETIDSKVADAYEKAILYYIESYVPEYFANPEADYDYKMAIMRALTENAPRKDDGSIDWDIFADNEYLRGHYGNAIALVDGEGGDKYFRKEDYAYYWDNETYGKGFETLEEAQRYIQTTAQNNPELTSEWIAEQKKNIKFGGESTNAGAIAYYTPGEYADMAFENWLSQNPQYAEDYAKLINLMNESASFAEFEGKISDDTRIAELMNNNDSLNLAWHSAKSGNGAVSYDVFKKILLGAYSGQDLLRHDDYMDLLSYGFGEGWEDQIASGEYVVDDEARERYQTALQDPAFNEYLDQAISKYEGLGEVVKALTGETELTIDAQAALAEVQRNESIDGQIKFDKNANKLKNTLTQLAKGGKNAEDAVQDLNQQMKQRDYAQYSLNAFKAGSAKDSDLSILSSFFGIEEEQLKKASQDMGSETSQWLLQSMTAELASYDADLADVFEKTILQPINDNWNKFAENGIDIGSFVRVDGSVDVSAQLSAIDAAGIQMTNTMRQYVSTLSLTSDGNSISIKFNQDGHKQRSGGGGGGQSKIEKYIDEQKKKLSSREHLIKMIQYQETKYENRGEFGNVNRMIEQENEAQLNLRKTLEDNLAGFRQQLETTQQGSEDWYKLREEILSTEEAIEETNITIEENTEKMKENKERIRQTRIALEEVVDSEIRRRLEKEREMLAGSVSMQDTITEAIRQRYQEEWDLVKRDIEKKKEALEEEKSLIDERLNARKEAEDEAEKYEQLSEYKRQLAMISMDSTRTKDAADLRKKIADIEKDIAWDIAEDEADATKQQIDDQIAAYDEFVEVGDEDMQAFLENANNFADEVKKIMGLSHDDLMNWLKLNVQDYANSLDDAKTQMLQTWEDQYKQMFGITDTYWEQINQILASKDSFLEYMMKSDEYINASETDKASMLYEWTNAYEDYLAAQKKDAEYSHEDPSINNSNTTTTQTKNPSNKNIIDTTKIQNAVKNVVSVGSKALSVLTTGSSILKLAGNIFGFSEGGNVDYTGLAMVHGSPRRPEAFLSADDRNLVRNMIDAMSYVRYIPQKHNIETNRDAGAQIEEVNVVINQAQINSDEDIEIVAQKVGEAFVKELSKTGTHTLKYSF